MRTKTIIDGFKNSQKIRVIVNRVPIYTTVKDMAYNLFGDTTIRAAVWSAVDKLARDRRVTGQEITGLTYSYGSYNNEVQVQVDLI